MQRPGERDGLLTSAGHKPSMIIALVLMMAIAVAVGVAVLVIRARAPAPDSAITPSAAPRQPGATAAAPPAAAAPRTDPRPRPPRPPPDERDAMEQIRTRVHDDPDGALSLIQADERAHPHSAFAEERAALRVDALVVARRIGVARDAAEEFLRRYPRGPRAQHIEMLTGVHPRPPEPED